MLSHLACFALHRLMQIYTYGNEHVLHTILNMHMLIHGHSMVACYKIVMDVKQQHQICSGAAVLVSFCQLSSQTSNQNSSCISQQHQSESNPQQGSSLVSCCQEDVHEASSQDSCESGLDISPISPEAGLSANLQSGRSAEN